MTQTRMRGTLWFFDEPVCLGWWRWCYSCTVPVLVQVHRWFSFLWGWAAPVRPSRFPDSVPVCLPFALHDATKSDASHVIPSFGITGMFPCEKSLPETILLKDSWRFMLEHDVRRNVLEQLMVSWHSHTGKQSNHFLFRPGGEIYQLHINLLNPNLCFHWCG